MKDTASAESSSVADYHDEFDNTDTRAFWSQKSVSRFTAPTGGQSRWYVCVFSVSTVLLLTLIISVSVTKVQVDRKLSAVQREISNLNQSLQYLTFKTELLDKQGTEMQQRVTEVQQKLNTLQFQSEDMSTDVQRIQEFSSHLNCIFIKLRRNDTQDQCCPLEWKEFSSYCYFFSEYGMSWHRARDECESKQAELLVLKTKEEKEFVIQRTKPYYYWLGLSDERTGIWEWLDGTPYLMVKSEWMPGQPDNWEAHGLGGGEDCAHFHRDGRYNDDHCSRNYRFVCKGHTLTVH